MYHIFKIVNAEWDKGTDGSQEETEQGCYDPGEVAILVVDVSGDLVTSSGTYHLDRTLTKLDLLCSCLCVCVRVCVCVCACVCVCLGVYVCAYNQTIYCVRGATALLVAAMQPVATRWVVIYSLCGNETLKVEESAQAMELKGKQKHSQLDYQDEFQQQNCTVG